MATPVVGPDTVGTNAASQQVADVLTATANAIDAAGGPYVSADTPSTGSTGSAANSSASTAGTASTPSGLLNSIESAATSAASSATSGFFSTLIDSVFSNPAANLLLIVVGVIMALGALLLSQSKNTTEVIETVGKTAAKVAEVAA